MRLLKTIGSQLHIYVLWLLFSALFWGWVFTLITDTSAEKKVTVFIDAYAVEDAAMAAALEQELPEGIRMVKVHPFSYAMFEESTLLGADIFIVRASDAAGYVDSFAPLTLEGKTGLLLDGAAYGVRVYDAAAGRGVAARYITYCAPGEAEEDYYLFFGADSLHTGERDDAALVLARRILTLE